MKNEIEIKNKYNGLVYYANQLARKYSKFTLEEQKVLHLIFAQINPYEKNPTTFKLSKLDFFDKLELESTARYPRYRKLVKGLIDKSFFEVKDEFGGESMGVVITHSYWKAKEPFFEVSLNAHFMPYLEELIKNFTKVNLNSVLSLKSKHALSLYKYICSWNDQKKAQNKRYTTTKELKELLGLSIDDYVYNGKFNRARFEKRTIISMIAEINEKTNIELSFKKNKKHNRVQYYEFTWTQKENLKIPKSVYAKKLQAECSIAHKNMYEENDCEKIHWLNNNNTLNDDADNGIVWDWDVSKAKVLKAVIGKYERFKGIWSFKKLFFLAKFNKKFMI